MSTRDVTDGTYGVLVCRDGTYGVLVCRDDDFMCL